MEFKPTPLNIIAKIISGVVHPMLMPLFGTWVLINLPSGFSSENEPALRLYILLTVALCTLVLPSISIGILKFSGKIKSVSLNDQSDRRLPFIFTGIFYTLCYVQILRIPMAAAYFPYSMIYPLMLGATISVVLALLVNHWFKISIHMMAVGGVCGSVITISLLTGLPLTNLIIALLAMAGLTGFARLQLNAHTPAQVYTGFLAGALCNGGLLVLLYS